MSKIYEPSLVRNGEDGAHDVRAARAQVLRRARSLTALAIDCAAASETFVVFEKALRTEVFAFARAVLVLFLVASEARVRATLTGRVVREGRVFRVAPAQSRNLMSWFGVVRYERTYLREVIIADKQSARGFHPHRLLRHRLRLRHRPPSDETSGPTTAEGFGMINHHSPPITTNISRGELSQPMLAQREHREVERVMRQAYRSKSSKTAKKQLENLARTLRKEHPSAAASLLEGLDETLTVLDFHLNESLTRTLSTTNPIENLNDRVRTVTRRVKRWRGGEMILRWVAVGLMEAERGFRALKGKADMPRLVTILQNKDRELRQSERPLDVHQEVA